MATTDTGKAISSQNACKHQLTGGSAWIPTEDRAAYDAHIAAQFRETDPKSERDKFLTQERAEAMWRLKRARKMETELLARKPNPFTEEDKEVSNQLARLTRYSQAIERTYYRADKELKSRTQSPEPAVAKKEKIQNELRSERQEKEKPFFIPKLFTRDPLASLTPDAEAEIRATLKRHRERQAA